ncbi:MAG TPA: hypothetical protein VGA27_14080, partial [Candidatus Binatia bacterium]
LKLPADLMHRRRKALRANRFDKKIVDRPLPVGQRGKHKAYILKIFSVINGAIKLRWFKPFKTFK